VSALGARHQRVQRLRRLLRRSNVREAEHAFVAEGAKVVEAAIEAGAPIESLFVSAGWRSSAATVAVVERANGIGLRVFELGPGVMERVADTVSPQSVCAVVGAVDLRLDELVSGSASAATRDVVIVCVDVRDPGNLGSILRVAGATGVSGVICCAGTVDPYNPKVVRASAGALFRLPLVTGVAPGEALGVLAEHGFRCWATVPAGGTDYASADLDGPTALVLGNEAAGLPEDVVARIDGALTIPMAEGTESLNVAMTAAVLCFEVARRRRPSAS
jgi:RNA methyltransferase, TrmH family